MTGTGADAFTAAVQAARAGDLATLSTLVDWPLSGAAGIAGSLPLVSESDRATGVASGFGELDAAAGNLALVGEILEPIARRLAAAGEVRPADPRLRDATLAALRIPDLPPGLTEEQRARFADLRRRAAALSEVYVVVGDTADPGPLAVARTADTGKLVLLID